MTVVAISSIFSIYFLNGREGDGEGLQFIIPEEQHSDVLYMFH